MATEVGVAYVNIVPKTDGFSSTVAKASTEAGTAGGKGIGDSIMGSLKSTVGDLFGTGGEMGAKLSGGMEAFIAGAGRLAIVGAIAAIGVEALKALENIGAEIDAMTDSIIVGTGASGDALEGLKQNAMSVATDVPVGFAKSGDIIQDFNTRLGLSGEELAKVSKAAAQLDYVVGGINYDNMATMFNVWGVGADEMTNKMDYMFGVAQNTGIGFDNLTSIMKTSGPTLQNLGFSFEESANMAGLLDKAGIDASSTMSKMSRALVELSQPGESAQDAFRRTVDEMQAFIDAGDTASAMNLAEELFGTRGAAQFIGALQSGALSMDALSDSTLGATGSIEGTYQAIADWTEQWELLKTKASAALEPLGSAVFSTLGGLLDGIGEAMNFVWRASEPLRTKIEELAAGIGERLQPIAEALGPILSELASGAIAFLEQGFSNLATVIGFVADCVSAFWDNVMVPFGQWIAGTWGPVLQGAYNMASSVFSGIHGAITSAMSAAQSFVSGATSAITNFLNFSGLGGIVSGVFNAVSSFIRDPIGTAKQFVSDTVNQIVGFFSGLGDRITSAIGSIHFPQPHIWFEEVEVGPANIPVPHIEWNALGGFVDGATLIGAGEAGPEMILPRSGGLMDEFADAVTKKVNANAGMTQNFTVNANDPMLVASVVASKQRRAYA